MHSNHNKTFLLTLKQTTMRKLTLLALLLSITATAQLKFSNQEYFTTSIGIDPTATIKEKGLPDLIAEVEYVGHIYAKLGFETFEALKPSYFDIHGAVGANLTSGRYERVRYYSGLRLGRIFRSNGTRGELVGFEAGIDYFFNKHHKDWFIGIRATYDHRNDVKGLGGDPYWRESGYLRIGFRF